MHVNSHGIWVPVVDSNFNTSLEVVGCGEIALRVGDWMPGKNVYLTEGCPVVIDDKFIREVIGAEG